MRKLIFCSLIFCSIGVSQQTGRTINPQTDARFTVTKTTTLSAAAEVVTVQNTTSSTKNVLFQGGSVYCSVLCTVTLEVNGTAASTTTLAPANINPGAPNAQTTKTSAYSSSNVGSGTTIATYQIGAGGTVPIDLSGMFLPSGVASNLTLRTNSITGTVTLILLWIEQ